jgi:aminopeptidase-like protein
MPDTSAVHNGADDNASGVASVLEIAEAFKKDKIKPDRSIIFMAFGAEEMGLLGSAYYVKNPVVELKKTYAMVNLDMVGKLDQEEPVVTIAGTGTAKEFNALLDSYKDKVDFDMAYSPDGYGASDHSSFYSDNVPVLFFNTGAHQDYHTPFDDVETLNYEGQEKVTKFILEVLSELSLKQEELTYVETGSYQGRPTGRGLRVTLGIIPGFGDTSNKGLRVDGTRKGGPAESGGMKKGDVITAINGEKIKNIYEYMDVLGKLKAGQQITVDVTRKEKTVVLIIQL